MDTKTIILIGAEGSGKGTQASILAKKLGFFHYDSGQLFRDRSDMVLTGGKTVGEVIDAGLFLSDDQVIDFLKQILPGILGASGIVFDGVPRSTSQAEFLLSYLKEHGREHIVSVYLKLSEDEAIKRLLKRAEIEKRADDTLDKIKLRLKQYDELTLPMLEYMRTRTEFIEIDGAPSIEEVAKAISAKLKLP